MHIGGVSIFEGPPPPFEELRGDGRGQARASCRATARRCASCRSASGGRSGSTTRTSTSTTTCATPRCPRRAASEQLRTLAARVFSQHLDRAKPLWEMWMVEGLERRPLGAALQGPPLHGRRRRRHRPDVGDVRRRAAEPAAPRDDWAARARAVAASSCSRAARSRARREPARRSSTRRRRCARRAKRCAQSPRSRARPLAAAARLRPVAPSSLNGPIGPHRRWSWAEARARRRQGGARGARRHGQRRRADGDHATASATLLEARGEPIAADRVVRTMVPVSVRRRGEQRRLQQPRLGGVRRLPVGDRRPGRAAGAHPRADGRDQGVQAGRRRATCCARSRASRRRCCSRSAAASRRARRG